MSRVYASVVLAITMAIAFPAWSAESLKGAMTQFGLIGEWAEDCSRPPSRNNAHTHWSAGSEAAGKLLTDFGPNTMSYDVHSAELIGVTRIRIRLVDNENGTQLELLIEKRDGRNRTLSSIRSDGSALIKDGRLVSTGADTVAQERCN